MSYSKQHLFVFIIVLFSSSVGLGSMLYEKRSTGKALLISTQAGDFKKCYYPERGKGGMMKSSEKCIKLHFESDYDALVSKEVLDDVEFDQHGLAEIPMSEYGAFYVNEDGNARSAKVFDMGADYFKYGLARTKIDNKIGFFNYNLTIVIPAIYDFAYPFEKGEAIVCMGCTQVRHGEHYSSEGGLWGVVNTKGKAILEIKYSKKFIWDRSRKRSKAYLY